MENIEISPEKKKIRIWLPDTVEKDGGVWVNATVHNVRVNYKDIIIEEGQKEIDIENTLSSFKGYKIEEL